VPDRLGSFVAFHRARRVTFDEVALQAGRSGVDDEDGAHWLLRPDTDGMSETCT
jgi:hypothetical protein